MNFKYPIALMAFLDLFTLGLFAVIKEASVALADNYPKLAVICLAAGSIQLFLNLFFSSKILKSLQNKVLK